MTVFYKQKVKIVEAIQFTRNNIEEIKQFTNDAAHDFMTPKCPDGKSSCLLDVKDNVPYMLSVTEGEYLVKKENKFLNYPQDYFEEYYEVVEEDNGID